MSMQERTVAIEHMINIYGEDVSISHYSDADDPVFNATTEEMEPGSPIIVTIKAIIQEPTKLDIESSYGKVTLGSKKVVVKKSTTVSLGDHVTIDDDSTPYIVDQIVSKRNRTFIFCSKNDEDA